MILSTTPTIEGKSIREYHGVVTGEAILGANIFRDLFAGIRDIVGGRSAAERVPVVLACGTAEENIGNNRVVAAALAAQGWDVRLVEHRDAHNWISWRDVLHPHLAELLVRAAR